MTVENGKMDLDCHVALLLAMTEGERRNGLWGWGVEEQVGAVREKRKLNGKITLTSSIKCGSKRPAFSELTCHFVVDRSDGRIIEQ